MKKRGLLQHALAGTIASMGHTDLLVVADAGLPVPPGVACIDLAVRCGLPSMLDVTRAVADELQVEEAIIADPAQVELEANLRHHARLARAQQAGWQPLSWWLAQPGMREAPAAEVARFRDRYDEARGRDVAAMDRQLTLVQRARAVPARLATARPF